VIIVEVVVTDLVGDPDQDEKRTNEAGREAGDVDQCEGFLAECVPESDREVVSEHGERFGL
jgi:hypothetical protein